MAGTKRDSHVVDKRVESGEDIFENSDSDSVDSGSADFLSQVRSQARQASNLPTEKPLQSQIAEIRSGYSELFKRLKEDRQSLIEPQNEQLVDLIAEANALHLKVQRTVDATIDSRFMAATAELGAEKLHTLPLTSNPFSLNDFSGLLERIINSDRADPFVLIGRLAAKHWKGVVGMETSVSLTEFNSVKAVRAERKKREQKSVGPVTRPTVVDPTDLKLNEQKETSDLVFDIYEQLETILQEHTRLPVLRVVSDPHDYGRSVERLFYISFLVADGKIFIEEDADGVLYVSLNTGEDLETGITRKRHRIVCMSMSVWKHTVKTYSIRQALIK